MKILLNIFYLKPFKFREKFIYYCRELYSLENDSIFFYFKYYKNLIQFQLKLNIFYYFCKFFNNIKD